MEKTWRWFGKNDLIKLETLREIGVEGIVSALHQLPNGEVWPLPDIVAYRDYIEKHGLRWSVVESLPVSEAIKYAGDERDHLIENYIQSLENLGKAGLKTICYNFMPVLDWARTDLLHQTEKGFYTLYFDQIKFAYFDLHILKRENAEKDYTPSVLQAAEELNRKISAQEYLKLIDTLIVKTQGFINGNISSKDIRPVEKFKKLLEPYRHITHKDLRRNLKYFLKAIMPVCEKYDIHMCIHPDDPPFPLLGLPRIITNEEDIDWLLQAVDSPHNGLTFCAGSLSSNPQNDVPKLAKKYLDRTKFVHLRSTQIVENGDFMEADHLSGRAHLIEVIRIFEREAPALPMRVDHGPLLSQDLGKGYNPGYSFLGRMLALGQVEGVMAAVKSN